MNLFKRMRAEHPGDNQSVTRKFSYDTSLVTLLHFFADVRIESDATLDEVQIVIKGRRCDQKLIEVSLCEGDDGRCVVEASQEGTDLLLHNTLWRSRFRKWLSTEVTEEVETLRVIIRVPLWTNVQLYCVRGDIDATRASLGTTKVQVLAGRKVVLGEVNGLAATLKSDSQLEVQRANGRVRIEADPRSQAAIAAGDIDSLSLYIGQGAQVEVAAVANEAYIETCRGAVASLATVNGHLSIDAGKNSIVKINGGQLRELFVIEAARSSSVVYGGKVRDAQICAEPKARVTISEVSGLLDAEIKARAQLQVPHGDLGRVSMLLGYRAMFSANGEVRGEISHDPSSGLNFSEVNKGLELKIVRDRP